MSNIDRPLITVVLAFTIFSSMSAKVAASLPVEHRLSVPEAEAAKAADEAQESRISVRSSGSDISVTSDHTDWSYDNITTGPDMWSTLGYPQCGGNMQSPINFVTEEIPIYEYNDLIVFEHYNDVANKVTVRNNGLTLVAEFDYGPARWRPSVSGGQLSGTYEFDELHFHWGTTGQQQQSGSEHTIDGVRAPLEMHMVHRNAKYRTRSEAVNKTDGILVLAALFEMNTNNIMPLLRSVESVSELVIPFNGSATLKPRPLATVLPEDTTGFFHYRGSLTTPGCQESVDWVVFEHSSHVIVGQLLILEELERTNGTKNLYNFRPVQKLNDRKVYHMVYKKPGHVLTKSSAPRDLKAISDVYGMVLVIIVLCKLSRQPAS